MANDLAKLPLKSLELPTKTVGKLKPLGLVTVGDLYAVALPRLIELGLGQKELEEIAEAASDFGVRWSSKDDVRAALGGSASEPAPKPKKTAAPKGPITAAKVALPADVEEAFSVAADSRVDVDVDGFASYVDDTGRNFRTPPPSPRHLRLFRRLCLLRDPSIGGAERNYLVGVFDVSQFPADRVAEVSTFAMHMGNLLADVLARMSVKVLSQQQVGSATVLAVAAKDVRKAQRLVDAFTSWVGAGPMHLAKVPAALAAFAEAGVRAANSSSLG